MWQPEMRSATDRAAVDIEILSLAAYCYCCVCVCVWGGELFAAVDMNSILLVAAYCYCCVFVWENCLLQLIYRACCHWQHTVIDVCVCVCVCVRGELFVAVDMNSILLVAAYCYCCVCVWESCLLQLIYRAYCYWQHTVIVVCLCGRAVCCS